MAIRFEHSLIDSDDVDFSEWSWGEDELGQLLKPLADHVAKILFNEILDSLKNNANAIIDLDDQFGDGSAAISLGLIDAGHIVIPLKDITLDRDMMLVLNRDTPGKYEVNWQRSIEEKQEAIKLLQRWISQLKELINLDREEWEKESAP